MSFRFWRRSGEEWLERLGQPSGAGRYGEYTRPPTAYGMTTDYELQMVETYARERFRGKGRIVDLGCWYGATSISLARGLSANNRASTHRTIEAIDLFKWERWMDPFADLASLPRRYAVGDIFYDDVRDLLRPYGSLAKVEQLDLLEYTPPAVPIEFLFIDAMKSWPLAQKIVHGFFPLLIAGNSYVVQQDFAYFFPEIATNHLIMWYLRDHFRCVHHVPYSCSVVFACTRPPDASSLPLFSPNLFTSDMVEEAYAYSVMCVNPEARMLVEIAKLTFLIEQGRREDGERQMDRVARRSSELDASLLSVVQQVAARAAAVPNFPQGWLGEIDAWVASLLQRTGGAQPDRHP